MSSGWAMSSVYGIRVAIPRYYSHPSSLDHDTGAHPERIGRIVAIESGLEQRDWLGYKRLEAPAVARETLLGVHSAEHVARIHALSERGGGALDLDTVMSAGSYVAALHSAGGAVALVDALLAGDAPTGFVGTRPPGHHADRSRGMGFCLFNNVAIAARHALEAHALERVLILDWDVHHGNGTNDIFAATDAVLFVSIHQSPLYPGTGPARDVGTGAGCGHTINLPVPSGSGDAVFVSHVEHLAAAIVRAYRPQLVLVSSGFDAHRDDPLASCTVTEKGFAEMTRAVRRVADEVGAPVGMVLEGGYDLSALTRSVIATLEALAAPASGAPEPPPDINPLTASAAGGFTEWWPTLGSLQEA